MVSGFASTRIMWNLVLHLLEYTLWVKPGGNQIANMQQVAGALRAPVRDERIHDLSDHKLSIPKK